MAFDILLLVIFMAILGAQARDGLWSNALMLINVITAGVLATNYFEPLADYMTGMMPSMVYLWDILVLGLLFAAIYLLLRLISKQLSKYRVWVQGSINRYGSIVLAAWTAWVAVCFVCFALHTAPLARNFFYNGFQPEQKMFFGLGPDRLWAGFVQANSDGGSWGRNEVDEAGNVTSLFDPKGDFFIKYATRRSFLEKQEGAFSGG